MQKGLMMYFGNFRNDAFHGYGILAKGSIVERKTRKYKEDNLVS